MTASGVNVMPSVVTRPHSRVLPAVLLACHPIHSFSGSLIKNAPEKFKFDFFIKKISYAAIRCFQSINQTIEYSSYVQTNIGLVADVCRVYL